MKVLKPLVDANGHSTSRWVNPDASSPDRVSSAPSVMPSTGAVESVQFDFDEDDKHAFLYGDCHVMAAYLRDTYGLPTVTVMADFSGSADTAGMEFAHILNELPNGMLVDVNGTHTEDEVLTSWGGYELVDGDDHIEMSFPQYGDEPDSLGDEMMGRLGVTRLA